MKENIIAILIFPLILLALIVFYAIIGICMILAAIFNMFSSLDFSGTPKRSP